MTTEYDFIAMYWVYISQSITLSD